MANTNELLMHWKFANATTRTSAISMMRSALAKRPWTPTITTAASSTLHPDAATGRTSICMWLTSCPLCSTAPAVQRTRTSGVVPRASNSRKKHTSLDLSRFQKPADGRSRGPQMSPASKRNSAPGRRPCNALLSNVRTATRSTSRALS